VQLRIDDAVRELFTSPSIVGSGQVIDTGPISLAADTGPRTLVLQVREHHDDRPTGADPFDIRDAADWIEPVLNVALADVTPPLAGRLARQLAAWQSWQLVSETSDLAWSTVYDQLSSGLPSYRLAVSANQKPLVLERELTLQADQRWLVVHATCGQKADAPPRIRVLADGNLLAAFDVPLLDRDHPSARPQAIALSDVAPDKPVRLRVEQLPNAAGTAVLWHSLAVTERRPDQG
jgi:hypothetical protein